MSAIQAAAALIDEIGAGTVDDILSDMPGYTRAQVWKALRNATDLGLIECDGRGPRVRGKGVGRNNGSLPTTYRSKTKTPVYTGPRFSSVWDMGAMVSSLTAQQMRAA